MSCVGRVSAEEEENELVKDFPPCFSRIVIACPSNTRLDCKSREGKRKSSFIYFLVFGNKLQTGILISFKYLSSALRFPFHLSFLIERKSEFPSARELNEYLIAGRVDPAAYERE